MRDVPYQGMRWQGPLPVLPWQMGALVETALLPGVQC